MSKEVRGDVPDEFWDWMVKNTPTGSEMSKAQILRHWLNYAYRQHQLQQMRATGQYMPEGQLQPPGESPIDGQ